MKYEFKLTDQYYKDALKGLRKTGKSQPAVDHYFKSFFDSIPPTTNIYEVIGRITAFINLELSAFKMYMALDGDSFVFEAIQLNNHNDEETTFLTGTIEKTEKIVR